MSPGDALYFKGGVYDLPVNGAFIPNGLHPKAKTMISGAPGEQVWVVTRALPLHLGPGKANIIFQNIRWVRTSNGVVANITDLMPRPINLEFIVNSFTNGKRKGSCVFSAGSGHRWIDSLFRACGVNDKDHGIYSIADDEFVEGSEFRGISAWGYHAYGPKEIIIGTTIRRSKFHENGDGGITLHNGHGALIVDNDIQGPTAGWAGVRVDGNRNGDKIIGNRISGLKGGAGILIRPGARNTEYRDNTVFNNTVNISDSGTGSMQSGNRTTEFQ